MKLFSWLFDESDAIQYALLLFLRAIYNKQKNALSYMHPNKCETIRKVLCSKFIGSTFWQVWFWPHGQVHWIILVAFGYVFICKCDRLCALIRSSWFHRDELRWCDKRLLVFVPFMEFFKHFICHRSGKCMQCVNVYATDGLVLCLNAFFFTRISFGWPKIRDRNSSLHVCSYTKFCA